MITLQYLETKKGSFICVILTQHVSGDYTQNFQGCLLNIDLMGAN